MQRRHEANSKSPFFVGTQNKFRDACSASLCRQLKPQPLISVCDMLFMSIHYIFCFRPLAIDTLGHEWLSICWKGQCWFCFPLNLFPACTVITAENASMSCHYRFSSLKLLNNFGLTVKAGCVAGRIWTKTQDSEPKFKPKDFNTELKQSAMQIFKKNK